MGVGRRRTRKLRAQCCQHQAIAGQRADFRTGNFFHGLDQRRQPQSLAASCFRSPWLKLLAHCLFPACSQTAVTNPGLPNPFPMNMP